MLPLLAVVAQMLCAPASLPAQTPPTDYSAREGAVLLAAPPLADDLPFAQHSTALTVAADQLATPDQAEPEASPAAPALTQNRFTVFPKLWYQEARHAVQESSLPPPRSAWAATPHHVGAAY